MKSNFYLVLILSFLGLNSFAQNRIGTWRSHLPFTNASKISLAGNKVYCSTEGGLFYYNTSDNSIDKLSKENGLSDSDISALGYSEELGIMVIAYVNSNIDLILGNTIYNIPDILQKQIMGDKRIYSILIHGDFAYLSTGFGIVALNLDRREITWTNDRLGAGGTQVKVNAMCFNEQFLYAATDQGIYKADINAENLQSFEYWNRINGIPDYDKKFNAITSVNENIFASFNSGVTDGDIIYKWDGLSWSNFSGFQNDNCNSLSAWKGNLVMARRFHVDVFNPSGDLIKHIFIGSPKCAFVDNNSVLWVADAEKGLIQNPDESTLNILNPNGPFGIFVTDIAIADNRVYTVAGGITSAYNNQYRHGEVNTFKDNSWSTYRIIEYKDFYRIAVDPYDPEHYFVASWGYGLFEFQKDSMIHKFTEENSPLQTIIPGPYVRLGGLMYDRGGNLWVTNSTVAEPVSVLKKNGDWVSFGLNNLVNSPSVGEVIETRSGYKWMILTPGRGLFVIDDNGTLDNPDDDRYLKLDVKDINNSIITNDVYAIAEDREGNIWLGTNKGVLVYWNPSRVFEGDNFYAQQVIVPRNDGTNYGDALLGTESVTAITVDGANRKWLGTKNAGAALVSDDGLTQIYNFTAENSPMLSNSITSIAVNDKNGEVFFGTDKGIISFVAEATGPAENFESVLVFPNPVRENFTGDIAITGLLENTTVKVTDLNGNLVFETISLGGQALWDGKNFRGEKVMTGVYLVFCSSEDGSLSHVTKLLFIH